MLPSVRTYKLKLKDMALQLTSNQSPTGLLPLYVHKMLAAFVLQFVR